MAHANLSNNICGDALLTITYILNCVPSKSVPVTPYELWNGKKPILDHLHNWGSAGYVHNPIHKHEKLSLRATKMVFIKYPEHSKGYVLFGEHPNGGMTEIDSCNVDFLEDEFPSIGEIKENLKLYELQEDMQLSIVEGEVLKTYQVTKNTPNKRDSGSDPIILDGENLPTNDNPPENGVSPQSLSFEHEVSFHHLVKEVMKALESKGVNVKKYLDDIFKSNEKFSYALF
ncbi:uncharacterized protein LOC110826200 [Carica papaya]|uniref:uncharacterized protein LOC110826200 n=1 Tax=Carica papaya TaxID=3649 RepID=UPI000B8CFEDB|nr:uncharacterized protein LOC110826200 [Carica papaya]